MNETPKVLLDWLHRARTGGIHRIEHGLTRFVPWTDVHADVNKVAVHLDACGIGPGARVGIRGDNSYEWLVLDLALLQLGAIPVAVPIPDFKGYSNVEISRRYGLIAIFAAKSGRASSDDETVVALESLLQLPSVTPFANPSAPEGERLPASDRAVFTLAFSSGTAGRVKCLLMFWPGVAKLIETTTEAYPMAPDDRIMIALPLSTFQQRFLCYLAIRNECDIVLTTTARYLTALQAAKPTVLLGPPNFYEFVEIRYRNEVRLRRLALNMAASLALILPAAALRKRWRRRVFRSFHEMLGGNARLLLIGSAPVRRDMLDFFARAGFELHQIYGMTETGYLTWNRPQANRIGSVGQEAYLGTVFLSDDGEVLIKHPWHICAGYEGEAAEDVAKVFLGDDVIATGDLGHFTDGYLYLRGRKKNIIVTTGGQKMQIEDLEFDLCGVPGINHAAMYETPDRSGLAVVVWYSGDRDAVREALCPRVQQVSSRLGADSRIRRIALIEGKLAQDSPLLNRNLKLNRDAVRAATHEKLETVDW